MRRFLALFSANVLTLTLGFVTVIDREPPQRPVAPPVQQSAPVYLDVAFTLAHGAVKAVRHLAEHQEVRQVRHQGCTDAHWRRSLGPEERWIDSHESGLDPTPADVNSSSGARGLGQLLPQTYASHGLTPSWSPCAEIHAQRAYMRDRYHSWAKAKDFWLRNRWW